VNPIEAGQILSYFTEAWPTMNVGEDTAVVWADALRGIDAQDAHTAARRLVQSDERPPSIARLIQAARGIAAGRMAHNALPAAPRLPQSRSAKLMAAINAYWAAVERPAHDHHRGPENCPCCSTRDERLKTGIAETTEMIHEFLAANR